MALPGPKNWDSYPLLWWADSGTIWNTKMVLWTDGPYPSQAISIHEAPGTLYTHHLLCQQTGWAPFPGTFASCPCAGDSGGGGDVMPG